MLLRQQRLLQIEPGMMELDMEEGQPYHREMALMKCMSVRVQKVLDQK